MLLIRTTLLQAGNIGKVAQLLIVNTMLKTISLKKKSDWRGGDFYSRGSSSGPPVSQTPPVTAGYTIAPALKEFWEAMIISLASGGILNLFLNFGSLDDDGQLPKSSNICGPKRAALAVHESRLMIGRVGLSHYYEAALLPHMQLCSEWPTCDRIHGYCLGTLGLRHCGKMLRDGLPREVAQEVTPTVQLCCCVWKQSRNMRGLNLREQRVKLAIAVEIFKRSNPHRETTIFSERSCWPKNCKMFDPSNPTNHTIISKDWSDFAKIGRSARRIVASMGSFKLPSYTSSAPNIVEYR
ncbi:hypothetical protein XELAEV_18007830mg [Xenopus laevis]|uniref:Uncharacterized protein n=1 Tax=Xenopus laevis TaxID=8355 RepID=A0A974E238_XENLA|nr:hypothetical protein XELAEV_18007830mg [Xenopus laevis]